jgi:hypothetical protein
MHQLGGRIHQKVELKSRKAGQESRTTEESRGKQDRKAEESRTDGNDPNANALE